MNGLFVVGTDTDVGKTVITAGLTLALRARGDDVAAMKPIQSGARAGDEHSDARVLFRLTNSSETPEQIAPFCFREPLAPFVAAGLEGRSLELATCVRAVTEFAGRHAFTIVEGAGGVIVPVGTNWTIAEFAAALGLPVLVVARSSLGTVNHTALTVGELRRRGLTVIGAILNGERDHSSSTNRGLIERFADVSVFGELPMIRGELTAENLLAAVEEHLDLRAIEALLISMKESAGA